MALVHIALAWLALGSAAALAAPPPTPSDAPLLFYRRQRSWAEFSEPLAALSLASPATSLHYVPGPRDGSPPRFLAVGDSSGQLLLLSLGGRVLSRHPTGTSSPVTALGSYSLARNRTVLITGHHSGEARLHILHHPPASSGGPAGGPAGGGSWEEEEEEWEQAGLLAGGGGDSSSGNGGGSSQLGISLLETIPAEALLCGLAAPGTSSCAAEAGAGACAVGAAGPGGKGACPPIRSVQASGKGVAGAGTAVVGDAAGGLAVLKHGRPSGSGSGGVRIARQSALEHPPMAVRLSNAAAAAAAVLGSSGVTSQRLTSTPSQAAAASPVEPGGEAGGAAAAGGKRAPAFRPCAGLDGSSIVAAAFDPQFHTRAYGLTDDGRVLSLVVGGAGTGPPLGCTVKASALVPPGLLSLPASHGSGGSSSSGNGGSSGSKSELSPIASRLGVAAVPGYLLVTAGDRLAVFNTTLSPRRAPRLLLSQPLGPLLRQLLLPSAGQQGRVLAEQQADERQQAAGPEAGSSAVPAAALLAANGPFVALMLNATVLALYELRLPWHPPPEPYKSGLAWLQLLQPVGMIGVAAMVIYRARNRRGGGGGGAAARGRGGAGAGALFSGDARLREFERLLQDHTEGATAGSRRARPLPSDWLTADGGSDSGVGSDEEDSLLGSLPRSGRGMEAGGSGGGGGASSSGGGSGRRSLFGRLAGSSRPGGSGGSGSGKGRGADKRRQRAASLAAADDREIAAMRAELEVDGVAAGVAGVGLGYEEMEAEEEDADGTGQGQEEPTEAEGGEEGPAGGDELSALQQRLTRARIA